MRKRPIAVLFRLNEKEHQHLKRQAAAAGLRAEQYIRALIAGNEIRPCPPEEYAELLRQLAAIGNNVNQIARLANGKKDVSQEEITQAAVLVQDAWQLVKDAF